MRPRSTRERRQGPRSSRRPWRRVLRMVAMSGTVACVVAIMSATAWGLVFPVYVMSFQGGHFPSLGGVYLDEKTAADLRALVAADQNSNPFSAFSPDASIFVGYSEQFAIQATRFGAEQGSWLYISDVLCAGQPITLDDRALEYIVNTVGDPAHGTYTRAGSGMTFESTAFTRESLELWLRRFLRAPSWWIVGSVALVWLAWIFWRTRIILRTFRRGCCESCGYELAGLKEASPICPECGAPAAPHPTPPSPA